MLLERINLKQCAAGPAIDGLDGQGATMQRFKDILYFADGEFTPGPAFARALSLARENQARLTLMDVTPESEIAADLIRRYGLTDDVQDAEQRHAALTHLAVDWAAEPTMRLRVPIGNPFIEVIRAVLRDGHDLVIKPARPRTGPAQGLLGSIDMHLLRKCPCPVWIDRPGERAASEALAEPRYRSILAAVDPVQPGTQALNRQIMDLATSLAGRDGAAVDVVHAWQLPFSEPGRGASGHGGRGDMDHARQDLERRHGEALDGFAEDYGLARPGGHVHLVEGAPAEQVLRLAGELSSDLIVMGTLGRTREPGLFIGTTAEDLLQGIRGAVLAVKPEGFVSPVAV
jgi:nucleotide-binding universal stress UspA family protein